MLEEIMVGLIAASRSGPRVHCGAVICLALRTAFVGAAPARATRGETILVSRASGADGAASNSWSGNASLSADGRVVAFSSTATNLSPDNSDWREDVFVRDLVTDETTLVTRAASADHIVPPPNTLRTCPSLSVSAYGRFVAFSSCARNLHPDDRDHETDVFVRDLATNETILVSRASGADGAKGNASSGRPSISADGRFVAFDSTATNLSPDARDGVVSRVFVRDLATGETTLVSKGSGAPGYTSSGSGPSLSADGRFVAFSSHVGETMPGGQETVAHVFVRDLTTGELTLGQPWHPPRRGFSVFVRRAGAVERWTLRGVHIFRLLLGDGQLSKRGVRVRCGDGPDDARQPRQRRAGREGQRRVIWCVAVGRMGALSPLPQAPVT